MKDRARLFSVVGKNLEDSNIRYMLAVYELHRADGEFNPVMCDNYVLIGYHYTEQGINLQNMKIPLIDESTCPDLDRSGIEDYTFKQPLHSEENKIYMHLWICAKAQEIFHAQKIAKRIENLTNPSSLISPQGKI